MNDLIDFSFMYDALLNKYRTSTERMAESPVRMFKYLLLKTIYTVSDVGVGYHLSLDYFLDRNPEAIAVNPISLTKF